MTNLEAISAAIGNRADINTEQLRSVLLLQGIDPDAAYDPGSACAIYGIALRRIANDSSMGVKSISEGGYSITYDSAGKTSILYELAKESGCTDLIKEYNPNPSITGVSVW